MEKESAVNLIDRIIADAKEAAAKVLADAEASCNGIRESQNAEIAEKNERFDREIARESEIILNGCRTRAELDGRKETLRAKRALLDGVFEKAYANMLELPAEKREALYRSILLREAKENDTVAPAGRDRDAIKAAAAKLPFAIRLSDSDADTEAGFILYGSGYEKDCSMKAILKELRGAEETNVAKILFR